MASKARVSRATTTLLSAALLGRCATTNRVDSRLADIGPHGGARLGDGERRPTNGESLFRQIGAEPTNARLHFDNGLFHFDRGRRGDLEVARVAFSNAARLAPDWWQPQFGLAATEYHLGRYDASL